MKKILKSIATIILFIVVFSILIYRIGYQNGNNFVKNEKIQSEEVIDNAGNSDKKTQISNSNSTTIDFSRYNQKLTEELTKELILEVFQSPTKNNIDSMKKIVDEKKFHEAFKKIVVQYVYDNKTPKGPLSVDDIYNDYGGMGVEIRKFIDFYSQVWGSDKLKATKENLDGLDNVKKRINEINEKNGHIFSKASTSGYVYFSYILNNKYSDGIIGEIEKAGNEIKKNSQDYSEYIGRINGKDVVLLVSKEDEYEISQGENYVFYEDTKQTRELVSASGFKSKAPVIKVLKVATDELENDKNAYTSLLNEQSYLFHCALINMGVRGIEGMEGMENEH